MAQEELTEKVAANRVRDSSIEAEQGIVKDWQDEEAGVRRKVDFILLPILALAFFAMQMDRGNISAVLTSTITEDLQITTNQINIGTQLLSAGIVLSELPSNMIMQRVGPRVWLSGQLFAWGLVATFQAFVQSYPAYLVTRILLGFCEGGYIPGALYYLSTWYKKDETSLRTSFFFYGQMFASATSSLISAGLLKLSGTHGLPGWRWIFLVEGLITLVIAIAFTLLVPPKVGDGRALVGFGRWSYFTERESHIIRNRVLLDDPRKATGQISISGSDIWKVLTQPRIMQHVLLTLVSMSGFQGLTQYTPSMIKSMGFSAVRANALSSVPVYCSIVWLTILSFAADYTGHRGPFVLLAITWNVISYVCLRTTPYSSSKWHRYGVIAVANVSYCSMHILNVGWLSVYCQSPQERSVALAFVVMAANLSGISGSQIFRTSDAPKYTRGLTAICSLAGVSWVLAGILSLQYYIRRRKGAADDAEYKTPESRHSDEQQVKKPFHRLHEKTWLHERPEKDVYKLLVDVYRLRMEDNSTFSGEVDADSIYGGASDGGQAGFGRFLNTAEAQRGLLPGWWTPAKATECIDHGSTADRWSSVSRKVAKHKLIAHYKDQFMPMQPRLFGEQVYGSGPGGQSGADIIQLQMERESGTSGRAFSMIDTARRRN